MEDSTCGFLIAIGICGCMVICGLSLLEEARQEVYEIQLVGDNVWLHNCTRVAWARCGYAAICEDVQYSCLTGVSLWQKK